MRHLDRLGSQFSISIPPDDEGLIGRECPVVACEGYFKIQPGTGLKGENLPCHCPVLRPRSQSEQVLHESASRVREVGGTE